MELFFITDSPVPAEVASNQDRRNEGLEHACSNSWALHEIDGFNDKLRRWYVIFNLVVFGNDDLKRGACEIANKQVDKVWWSDREDE